MKKIGQAVKATLSDLARLDSPALATALVGGVVAAVKPFGLSLGADGTVLAAAVVGVGAVSEVVLKLLTGTQPKSEQ